MKFFDYIRITYKNFVRQKTRTFLTVAAVMIGAVAVLIMFSIVLGARQSFLDQMEQMGEFTRMSVERAPRLQDDGSEVLSEQDLDDDVVADITALPHVARVRPIASVHFEAARLEGEDTLVYANFRAHDPDPEYDSPVMFGRQLREGDVAKVVVGEWTVRDLGYESNPEDLVGKTLLLTTYGGYTGWGADIPSRPPVHADESYWDAMEGQSHTIEAEIVGVTFGFGQEDYTTLSWGRDVLTYRYWDHEGILQTEYEIDERGYDTLVVHVAHTDHVEAVAEQIRDKGFRVSTFQEILEEIQQMISGIMMVLGMLGGIALLIAALGIINTMIMAIYERTKEIGVMRACGATRRTIRRLFTFEAALIGCLGGVVGWVFAYALSFPGNWAVNHIAQEDGIPISDIITFPWWLIVSVIAFTTFVGLVSGLYPAIRASRLHPVDALRRE